MLQPDDEAGVIVKATAVACWDATYENRRRRVADRIDNDPRIFWLGQDLPRAQDDVSWISSLRVLKTRTYVACTFEGIFQDTLVVYYLSSNFLDDVNMPKVLFYVQLVRLDTFEAFSRLFWLRCLQQRVDLPRKCLLYS